MNIYTIYQIYTNAKLKKEIMPNYFGACQMVFLTVIYFHRVCPTAWPAVVLSDICKNNRSHSPPKNPIQLSLTWHCIACSVLLMPHSDPTHVNCKGQYDCRYSKISPHTHLMISMITPNAFSIFAFPFKGCTRLWKLNLYNHIWTTYGMSLNCVWNTNKSGYQHSDGAGTLSNPQYKQRDE